MPRNRQASRSSAPRPAPRPVPRPAHNTAPLQRAQPPPPPMQAQPSASSPAMAPLAATVADGIAFGTGSAIAHRAADAIMGPRLLQHEVGGAIDGSPEPANALSERGVLCENWIKSFQNCVQVNESNIGKCQFYLDMLQECRRNVVKTA